MRNLHIPEAGAFQAEGRVNAQPKEVGAYVECQGTTKDVSGAEILRCSVEEVREVKDMKVR